MWTDFRRIRMKIRELQRRQWAAISRFAYTCTVSIRLEQVKHNFCPAACCSPRSGRCARSRPAPGQPRERLISTQHAQIHRPANRNCRGSKSKKKKAIWHHCQSRSRHRPAAQHAQPRAHQQVSSLRHRSLAPLACPFPFPYPRPKFGRLPRERLR